MLRNECFPKKNKTCRFRPGVRQSEVLFGNVGGSQEEQKDHEEFRKEQQGK